MDRFLNHIDLPQNAFNAASTTVYGAPARTGQSTGGSPASSASIFSLRQSGATAISFVGSSKFSSGTSIPNPTGIQVGDLLLFFADCASGNSIVTPGYTLFVGSPITSTNSYGVYYKVADSGDVGGVFTVGSAYVAGNDAFILLAYRAASIPEDASIVSFTAGTAATVAFPELPNKNTNGLAVYAISSSGDTTLNAPAATIPTMPSGTTTMDSVLSTGGVGGTSSGMAISGTTLTATVIPGGTEIDIGGNPSAGFTRLRARYDDTLQNRSASGVDTQLGGVPRVVSAVLGTALAIGATATPNPITGLAISIPPGKTARINLSAVYVGQGATTSGFSANVVISNPSGADGSVTGSWFGKFKPIEAASASAVADGDVFTVAANTSTSLSIPSATAASPSTHGWLVRINLKNNSNTTSVTVTPSITPAASQGGSVKIGSAIFAVIT